MDHLAAIRRECDRFYAIAHDADPTLGVPSCPDWSIGDLVWHLGEVHWFWGTDIATRASSPDELEAMKPARPTTYPDVLRWAHTQTDRLVELLESTPPDVAVWTWALNESDHTVGFIARHQVQEAAVHRWDLQNAASTGLADPIDAEAASDSIDEVLAITLPWSVRPDKTLPGTVHLHCTDTEGEWFVHPDGRVERIHAKGDVAMRGAASELLLALYNRVPLDSIDVIGDAALASTLVERINTD